MKLFDYQENLVSRLRESLRVNRRVCLRLPTGGGKTVIFSYIARNAALRGKRVCIVVHRRELIDQCRNTIDHLHGVIAAGYTPNKYPPIQIASVDTLVKRMNSYAFDLMIWDECHHAPAGTWARVAEHYADARHLGVTATPIRLDGKPLAACYDDLVIGPTVPELIARKRLCPGEVWGHPNSIDTSGLRATQAGDFNQQRLNERADRRELIGDMVSHYRMRADGLPFIGFAVSVEHSQHCVEQFNAAGIRCLHVDGNTPREERKAAFDGLRSGLYAGIWNVNLVSEGFDVPVLECVIDAQPTASLSRHIQKMGRGARTAPGKTRFLYLDHAGNVSRHMHGPNQDRQWSLEGKPAADTGAAPPPISQCPACYYVFEGRGECPKCGHVPEAQPREIQHRDGALVRLTDEEIAAQAEAARLQDEADRRKREVWQATSIEELERICAERNYKPGWVRHQVELRKRFGRPLQETAA